MGEIEPLARCQPHQGPSAQDNHPVISRNAKERPRKVIARIDIDDLLHVTTTYHAHVRMKQCNSEPTSQLTHQRYSSLIEQTFAVSSSGRTLRLKQATFKLSPARCLRALVNAELHDPWLGGNSDLLLSRSSSFMFMAASSAARYLNTYGIATVSIPLLVLQAWHAKFF